MLLRLTHQARGQRFGLALLQLSAVICLPWFHTVGTQQDNDAVVLHVTVTNEKGEVIPGLQAEDFSVVADKLPQKIISFSGDGAPASVGILVDASGSLSSGDSKGSARIRQRLKEGIGRLLELSNASNEYFAVAFSSEAGLLQDWTSDHRSVVDKLGSLEFKGQTSLYDTSYRGIQKVMTGRHSRHVIVVVSDGQDNASKHSFNELRDLLRNSDVILYAVGFVGSSDAGSSISAEGQKVLDELTKISGGRALFPRDSKPAEMNEIFELMATELRTQYRLVIKPERSAAPKKWRKIKVKATQVDASGHRKELSVRTREGYY